jgi:formylglycine-generating enzyme required for sulfatase activity/tRNA A-37 threonylcarbamoyl transferase component Bud32
VEDARAPGEDDPAIGSERASAVTTHESEPSPSRPLDDPDALARGATIGRYLVLDRVGAGAMGNVFAAYDPDLDRKVAIKVLRQRSTETDRARGQARLVREAKAIAKLSHPNVVSIHDVGVHDGQVFLAMEFLAGGTLREWMNASPRSWREVVKLFVEIGRGLAAAHTEGLTHRDFKPENVLLDKDGKPKVADFGLVRLSGTGEQATSAPGVSSAPSLEPRAALSADGAAPLTRTRGLMGTPSYMAPEQFLGGDVGAASDQFAFCVALYEALHGERPFQGRTLIELADSVVEGQIGRTTKGREVAAWVQRILLRGLAREPQKRFPSMSALVRQLDRDAMPARKVAFVAGTITIVAAALGLVVAVVGGRLRAREQIEASVDRNLRDAGDRQAKARGEVALTLRWQSEANHLFDEGSGFLAGGAKRTSWSAAEAAWARALEAKASADADLGDAGVALEAALFLDPKRSDVRDRFVDVLESRLRLAEGTFQRDVETELLARLRALNVVGAANRGSKEDAQLELARRSPDLKVALAPYRATSAGRLTLGPARELTDGNIVLSPGSYLLSLSRDAERSFRLPVLLHRGERLRLALEEPRWSAIPSGFVFIHAGDSLIGSNEENLRVGLDVPPMHVRSMGSYLIGRDEVTFGDYIQWLEKLPPVERTRRLPRNRALPGTIELIPAGDHEWTLLLQPSMGHRYVATWGEPIRYAARAENVVQDWRRFPVTGISFEDAQAYARWLDQTGRVRGAHVCREDEWERAARGADGRVYANGWTILPSDANMDLTYGGTDEGFGPDEVGKHPVSDSPFGVEDMEGNAVEMVAAGRWNEVTATRGGSWYNDRVGQRADNRFRSAPSYRYLLLGFRICAPAPKP